VKSPSIKQVSYGLLLLLLVSAACAPTANILTDQGYLNQGKELLADNEYGAARGSMNKLLEIYPDSPLAAQARLIVANSYYNDEDYAEAIIKYQELLRYHPRSKLVEQAQYKMGMSYADRRLTPDRDKTDTRQAIAELQKYIQEHPDNAMRQEAQDTITICREELAQHEYDVGRFYLKTGSPSAAVKRFRRLLLDYPKSKLIPSTIFYLGQSYWELGKRAQARQVFSHLLESYPNNEYAEEARQRTGR